MEKRKRGRPISDKSYNKVIHGIIDDEVYKEAVEYCKSKDISFSKFLRLCIDDFMSRI